MRWLVVEAYVVKGNAETVEGSERRNLSSRGGRDESNDEGMEAKTSPEGTSCTVDQYHICD
jgi:hypothetical protein